MVHLTLQFYEQLRPRVELKEGDTASTDHDSLDQLSETVNVDYSTDQSDVPNTCVVRS